jgi:hypothetical protein
MEGRKRKQRKKQEKKTREKNKRNQKDETKLNYPETRGSPNPRHEGIVM